MRKFILPAILATVVGLAILPAQAQASWLSEIARHTRVDIYPGYVTPVYASPIYASPYTPYVVTPQVYVPPVSVLPAPLYYPYRYDVYTPSTSYLRYGPYPHHGHSHEHHHH